MSTTWFSLAWEHSWGFLAWGWISDLWLSIAAGNGGKGSLGNVQIGVD